MRAAILLGLLALLIGCGGESPNAQGPSAVAPGRQGPTLEVRGAQARPAASEARQAAAPADRVEPAKAEPPTAEENEGEPFEHPPDALDFLTASQCPDGGWEEAGDGSPQASDDPALTGLVLLAYLHAGYTNRGKHPHCKAVARGARFLRRHQDAGGRFEPNRTGATWVGHALGTLAMVTLYRMTGSPIWKRNAVAALRHLEEGLYHHAVSGVLEEGLCIATLLQARQCHRDRVRRDRKPVLRPDEGVFAHLAPWAEPSTERGPLGQAVHALALHAFVPQPTRNAHLAAAEQALKSAPFVWPLPGQDGLDPTNTAAPSDPRAAAFWAWALGGRRRPTIGRAWLKTTSETLAGAQLRSRDAGASAGSWSPPAHSPTPALGRVALTAWLMQPEETAWICHFVCRKVGPPSR